ncbi:MAG: TIGR03663 family protein [Verrucomicrobia bacterium]|nr:TIGR03663 family protein [Verrucomicrobiota bacterium]
MRRGLILGLILAAAGALALRGPRLDLRPMHNDEAVNGFKIQELLEEGRYRYDPDEYHGPTLHYATLPFLWLSGARDLESVTEKTLRAVPVAFGVALVMLTVLVADGLGRPATLWASALMAISPALVFYSRYFIHEMLLVCFTQVFLGAAWRYGRRPNWGWAGMAGAGLGLMYATKETFVLEVIALGMALALSFFWDQRWRFALFGRIATFSPHEPGSAGILGGAVQPAALAGKDASAPSSPVQELWNWRHLAVGLGVALAISGLLFTSFLTNLQGLIDSIRTYFPWGYRAQGHSAHVHPWYFYLERLAFFRSDRGPLWTEGLILVLAAVGGFAGFRRSKTGSFHSGLVRFLSFYTVALTVIYSAIPYKTPWCLLGFLHPMILLAGVGAAFLLQGLPISRVGTDSTPSLTDPGDRARNVGDAVERVPTSPGSQCAFRGATREALSRRILTCRTATWIILLAGAGHLTWEAWRANFGLDRQERLYAADRGNPYVYAQTVPDILELVEKVTGLAATSPDGQAMRVHVIAPDSDYWPLPWYFRGLSNVWWLNQAPANSSAPVVIAGSGMDLKLDEQSNRAWTSVGLFTLRPRVYLDLFVESGLWRKYVEARNAARN